MRNEFDKCYFCKAYDEYDVANVVVRTRKDLNLITTGLLRKQKKKGISVADVIALMNVS